jgi:hypothetical protein
LIGQQQMSKKATNDEYGETDGHDQFYAMQANHP